MTTLYLERVGQHVSAVPVPSMQQASQALRGLPLWIRTCTLPSVSAIIASSLTGASRVM